MEPEQIFWKPLTSTDVTSSLVIPIEWLERFPHIPVGHHLVEFIALDSKGCQWHFCLSIRTKDQHPKPVLNRRGWRAFVKAKSLKIGDEITFSREANEANEVILRIRTRKFIMRLMGQNIYEDEAM